METIAFYAYKGGTGRTLVVANIARYLALFGQRVVALDFDLEAPGLHYKLDRDTSGNTVEVRIGLVDYLDAFINEKSDRSLREFIIPIQTSPNSSGKIDLFPAGSVHSADYWRKLSKINWQQIFYDSTVGMHLFLELKERIREELKPDFLLIDSRTGITEIGGVATGVMADKVVCLLLNNRENVEGVSTVLRSLRRTTRPPGAGELIAYAAVTRIPLVPPAFEEQLVAGLLESLNGGSEQLKEGLGLSELFVLHSEPELQIEEALRVGEQRGVDQSRLLRDYIRLFSKIIPREVIRPHVGKLLSQTREIAFDDPDRAEESLESITQSLGDADAYRELLKFYHLRNVIDEKVLRAAQRLWEMDRSSDLPLFWQTVQAQIPPLSAQAESIAVDLLNFAENVWRAIGSDDKALVLILAMEFSRQDMEDHAADLTLELLERTGPDGLTVARCVRYLQQAGREEEIETLLERYRPVLMDSAEFLVVLAQYALDHSRSEILTDLSKPYPMAVLSETQPLMAYRVAASAGRLDEAKELAERALESAVRKRSVPELQRVRDLFDETGRSRQFEEGIRRLPRGIVDRVMGTNRPN